MILYDIGVGGSSKQKWSGLGVVLDGKQNIFTKYLSGGTQSVPRGGTSKCTINKREK